MLKSNKFLAQYRVYYEDTDAGGVMYYANYLKFFERSRTDFLRYLEIVQSDLLLTEKTAFVVKHCDLDLSSPARLDDLVEVSVVVEKVNAASVIMRQEMTRNSKLLAVLGVTIVCVDVDSFKPKRISDQIRFKIS